MEGPTSPSVLRNRHYAEPFRDHDDDDDDDDSVPVSNVSLEITYPKTLVLFLSPCLDLSLLHPLQLIFH